MSRKQPLRLWADVPDGERVDEAFLQTRHGALTPGWVEHHLRQLEKPDGCAKAIPWSSERGKWKRCSCRVAPGEQFCYHHGGPKPPKIVYVKVVPDPRVLQERNERRRQTWLRKRQEADDALAALDRAVN